MSATDSGYLRIMIVIIVILYVVSLIMPLCGLLHLYFAALKEAELFKDIKPRDDGKGSRIELATIVRPLADQIRSRPAAVVKDFILIGGGIALGTAASIWSLFL